MKAELLFRERRQIDGRSFADLVVWQVPAVKAGTRHKFKYRLAYVIEGDCVLRYDNEAGKGDHVHRNGNESPYNFTTLDKLFDDFIDDIDNWSRA